MTNSYWTHHDFPPPIRVVAFLPIGLALAPHTLDRKPLKMSGRGL